MVSTVAAIVFFGLWIGARSDADDAESQLATINAEAEADAADELPNLEKIAGEHRMASQGAIESASETSLSLNFDGSSVAALDDLEELLAALGFSDAIMDRISNTRALDGTLTADGRTLRPVGPITPTTV